MCTFSIDVCACVYARACTCKSTLLSWLEEAAEVLGLARAAGKSARQVVVEQVGTALSTQFEL